MPDGGVDIQQAALIDLAARYAEGIARPVFWLGAGVSSPANLPTWVGLRDQLIRAARKKASTLDKAAGDLIRNELAKILLLKDYWAAFDRLHEILHQVSYTAEIRAALGAAQSVEIPNLYNEIWKLKIDGIVTLNLDQFATRAYINEKRGIPVEFTGQQCGRFHHVLRSRRQFVVNMHGIHDDVESWVFRTREIRALQAKGDYKSFVNTLFGSKTVVFLGLSAEDRAAGGLLEKLIAPGVDFGGHFWITNRTDGETDAWAEGAGIRVIRYDADSPEEHTARIKEILQYISRAASRDSIPEPVVPNSVGNLCVFTPDELAREHPEKIRLQLNSEAARILKNDAPPYPKFSAFCEEYGRPIFYSWHVNLKEGENEFFGYKLQEEVGSGAFGTVYRALDGGGQNVAVKLLRQEVRADEKMLGSFRRGVASMRILSDRKVEGMVPYLQAFELPPAVIMDFVQGDTLERAVEASLVNDIDDIIDIAQKTAAIIRRGHLLPERVLHRDIRPSNIMIKDLYNDEERRRDVVVLDFDLSWHKNALEKSISSHATTALGYLAPEQISKGAGVSTRHTAVDSYGLAMTLYFMVTRSHPIAGENLAADWVEKVVRKVRQKRHVQWNSVSNRLARLICAATRKEQSERPDFGEVHGELQLLLEVCRHPEVEDSAELWGEEIFVRAMPHKEYQFDEKSRAVGASFASGVQLTLTPNEEMGQVSIAVAYQSQGNETYKSVGKYLPTALDQLMARLRGCGWEDVKSNRSHNNATISAFVTVPTLRNKALEVVSSLVGLDKLFDFQ